MKNNFKTQEWAYLGQATKKKLTFKKRLIFGEKHILIDEEFVKLVDFKENTIQYFKSNASQQKILRIMPYNSFYCNGAFYCFESKFSIKKMQLIRYEEKDFFGEFVKEVPIYKTSQTKNTVIAILASLAFLLLSFLSNSAFSKQARYTFAER